MANYVLTINCCWASYLPIKIIFGLQLDSKDNDVIILPKPKVWQKEFINKVKSREIKLMKRLMSIDSDIMPYTLQKVIEEIDPNIDIPSIRKAVAGYLKTKTNDKRLEISIWTLP